MPLQPGLAGGGMAPQGPRATLSERVGNLEARADAKDSEGACHSRDIATLAAVLRNVLRELDMGELPDIGGSPCMPSSEMKL